MKSRRERKKGYHIRPRGAGAANGLQMECLVKPPFTRYSMVINLIRTKGGIWIKKEMPSLKREAARERMRLGARFSYPKVRYQRRLRV